MLSDIQFETKTIKYRDSAFTVRGLGLDIISKVLVTGARGQLEAAVTQLQASYETHKAGETGAFDAALMSLATSLPDLVATVIALCADEPDAAGVVSKLPLPVQIDALIAIGKLTFDGEESLKNFVSGLIALMGSTTKAVSIAGQIVKTGTQS